MSWRQVHLQFSFYYTVFIYDLQRETIHILEEAYHDVEEKVNISMAIPSTERQWLQHTLDTALE